MGKQRFYGTVQGNGVSRVERCGSKANGVEVDAAGWMGRIKTRVYHDHATGKDMFKVWILPHWEDSGNGVLLAEGILDHRIEDAFVVPALFA